MRNKKRKKTKREMIDLFIGYDKGLISHKKNTAQR